MFSFDTILAFSAALLFAVFLSQVAKRTALSTAVIFLFAGFLVGGGALRLLLISPTDPNLTFLVELALVAVLYTDGMQVDLHELGEVWRLPGRALFLGLPLTVVVIAVLGRLISGLSWGEALLVGAVLSPTDPVFASAIVTRTVVPQKLRRLLNIESGMNDGLALPIVIILLAINKASQANIGKLITDVAVGILIGIALPWIIFSFQKRWPYAVSRVYKPIFGFTIILLVYTVAQLVSGNLFLAAYSAGIAVATFGPDFCKDFKEFGEPIAELLKLVSIFLFGALFSYTFFKGAHWTDFLFGALVLVVARPVAMWISLLGSSLNLRERLAAAWFGPRGFSSVVYALFVYRSGIPNAGYLTTLAAIAVIVSMIVESSTDTFIAHRFAEIRKEEDESEPEQKTPEMQD